MALQLAAVKMFWEDNTIAASSQSRIQTSINKRSAVVGTAGVDQVIARMRYNFSPERVVGGSLYYLHNEASSQVPTYRAFRTSSADTGEQSIERNFLDTDSLPKESLVDEWIVYPGYTYLFPQIINESWTFYVRCQITDNDTGMQMVIRCKVYRRSYDEDFLAYSDLPITTVDVGPTTAKGTRSASANISTTLTTVQGNDDYLVVKYYIRFQNISPTT